MLHLKLTSLDLKRKLKWDKERLIVLENSNPFQKFTRAGQNEDVPVLALQNKNDSPSP